MPHITFPLADLEQLSGSSTLDLEQVGELVKLVKGELKHKHSSRDEVKVELQDTNRPDTWCVEGIARQIRQHRTGQPGDYAFFSRDFLEQGGTLAGKIEVEPSVAGIRPYVAGFVARGYAVDDAGLKAFISAQEVLCRNFGRQRKGVAIGIYDASKIEFPVRYAAVPSESQAFVPLAPNLGEGEQARDGAGEEIPAERWQEAWTPAEILRDHPTGREYADAVPDPSQATLLLDAGGRVLSYPPLINSADLGRVNPGMNHLFVEVTGTVLDQVLLAANILAANLADRGAQIEATLSQYSEETARGTELRCPHPLEDRLQTRVAPAAFGELLGEPDLEEDAVTERLRHFGLSVEREGEQLLVSTLPYRTDYLHAVDAIEDFAISRGYDAFEPLMPEEFTVGSLSALTRFADQCRDFAIGCGLEETIGNLLCSVEEVRERMLLDEEQGFAPFHGGKLVRIQNVMNLNYSVLRDWLLPTLLEIEARSTGAHYPHRFFEAGEVCVWDADENLRSRSERRLAAAVADHEVGFSETQAYLDAFLHTLGLEFTSCDAPAPPCGSAYSLVPTEHPSFIPGRAAHVVLRRSDPEGEASVVVGLIGEVHPGVLTRWSIRFPVAAFELRIDALHAWLG